jgi:hypothetical protein
MAASANRQRSNDSGHLNKNILSYVLEDPSDVLNPHIDPGTKKSQTRGYYHLQIGALIVPLKYYRCYMRDPKCVYSAFRRLRLLTPSVCSQFRLDLESGDLDFNETLLPSFLFPTNLAYNSSKPWCSVFHGFLVPRVSNPSAIPLWYIDLASGGSWTVQRMEYRNWGPTQRTDI